MGSIHPREESEYEKNSSAYYQGQIQRKNAMDTGASEIKYHP
jgi:hypothetical protein